MSAASPIKAKSTKASIRRSSIRTFGIGFNKACAIISARAYKRAGLGRPAIRKSAPPSPVGRRAGDEGTGPSSPYRRLLRRRVPSSGAPRHLLPRGEGAPWERLMTTRSWHWTPCGRGFLKRAEDWRWSGVAAHLAGRDDGLVSVAPRLESAVSRACCSVCGDSALTRLSGVGR